MPLKYLFSTAIAAVATTTAVAKVFHFIFSSFTQNSRPLKCRIEKVLEADKSWKAFLSQIGV